MSIPVRALILSIAVSLFVSVPSASAASVTLPSSYLCPYCVFGLSAYDEGATGLTVHGSIQDAGSDETTTSFGWTAERALGAGLLPAGWYRTVVYFDGIATSDEASGAGAFNIELRSWIYGSKDDPSYLESNFGSMLYPGIPLPFGSGPMVYGDPFYHDGSAAMLTQSVWSTIVTGSNTTVSADLEFPASFSSYVLPADAPLVPEPETVVLMALGLSGLVWFRRRRRA